MKLSAPQCLQTGTKCPGELCEISESSTMYTVTCMHCSALKVYPVVHTAHVTVQSIVHVVQCMWSMPVNACTNIKHGKSVKMPWWHHNCQVSIWSHGQWMVQKCQELHIITLYLQISKCPTTKGRYGAGRASEKKKTSALCTLSMLEVLSLISQNRGCTNGTITLLILGHSANWSDIGGHWKNIWHLRPNILQTGLKKVEPSGTKVQHFFFLSFLRVRLPFSFGSCGCIYIPLFWYFISYLNLWHQEMSKI